MKKITFVSCLILFSFYSLAQTPRSRQEVDAINRKIDSLFRPNKAYDNPTTFEGCLFRDYSEYVKDDGRWVYYPGEGHIVQVVKPEVLKIMAPWSFYKVRMTNYLGYHVNTSTCLVLYDSILQKTALIEPIWYFGESEMLLRSAIGKNFSDSALLKKFVQELQELMLIGTSGKFTNTAFQAGKINFDLVFGHVTESPGIINTASNIWRKYQIVVEDFTIRELIITNPATKQSELIK